MVCQSYHLAHWVLSEVTEDKYVAEVHEHPPIDGEMKWVLSVTTKHPSYLQGRQVS